MDETRRIPKDMDAQGRIRFMDPVAETLTDWWQEGAAAHSVDDTLLVARDGSEVAADVNSAGHSLGPSIVGQIVRKLIWSVGTKGMQGAVVPSVLDCLSLPVESQLTTVVRERARAFLT